MPLTRITRKGIKFCWDNKASEAFAALKEEFVKAPLLRHPNMELPFFVKADSSDYAMGAVLLQQHEEEKLYPVAFYSRKFSASEINYEVHDK